MAFRNNNYNLIKCESVNSKNINKQIVFGIFRNTQSVIKRNKIAKKKELRLISLNHLLMQTNVTNQIQSLIIIINSQKYSNPDPSNEKNLSPLTKL